MKARPPLTGASNQHLVFAHSELAMRCVFGEIMSTAPHCRVILSCLLISPCRFAFPCLLGSLQLSAQRLQRTNT